MKSSYLGFVVASIMLSGSSAHMMLGSMIPPFPGGDNSPLSANQKFCKGLQKEGGGTAVKIGKNQFNLAGSAVHGGGSMQASLSFDGGKSFKVVTSYMGGFPRPEGGDHTYDFEIPEGTKAGPAIFSWSWSNKIGNREFYQDCAPVTIEGSGTSMLDDYPDIFVSNMPAMGTDCANAESAAVKYPNPGKVVQMGTDQATLKDPTGNCGKVGAQPAAPAGGSSTPPASTTGSAPPPTPAPGSDTGSTGAGSYTVKAGDTCSAIAEFAKKTVADIVKLAGTNPECTDLAVGKVLTLRKRSRIMI